MYIKAYEGWHIPYPDRYFDVGFVVFVLHHIPHATHILREIARTCHRIVVVEDVPTGPMHRLAIDVLDGLGNWEFFAHPHSNHTAEEWHGVFNDAIPYPYCVTQPTAWYATAKASLMGHHIFQMKFNTDRCPR